MNGNVLRVLIATAALFTGTALQAADGFTTGYKAGGDGFFLNSNDDNIKFSILGFAQAQQTWSASKSYKNSGQVNSSVDYTVPRARLDFIATFNKNYELLIENDFAPVIGGANAGPGLVIAQITAGLYEEILKLRVGKFVVPFSTEGYRSSRDFDTINRYMTLNTMYFLPSEDVQYGVMLFGKLLEHKLAWFVSVVNGSEAVTLNHDLNIRSTPAGDNKQVDAKVTYDFSDDFKVGIAGQIAQESPTTVGLYDLMYTPYNTIANVTGKRYGFTPDIWFRHGSLDLRAEAMWMKWGDSAGSPTLFGGFAQVGYFISGDKNGGFEPLLRFEYNKLTGPLAIGGADHLTAVLAGWQWYLNANVRHQLNAIATIPAAAGAGAYTDGNTKYAVLSELQLKF